MGILIHLAKRWVAGEYLEDAVKRAKYANNLGICGIINHVGEHFSEQQQIEASASEYCRLLEAIKSELLDCAISIKLTQLGLMKDVETCVRTVEPFIKKAADQGTLIWIDMEGSPYTQQIIDIYKILYGKYRNLGIAIQAYLLRTPEDLNELSMLGAKIRLCKGAYNEPGNIVIRKHEDIRKAFAGQMEKLFVSGGPELIAVATHDTKLIQLAKQLNKEKHRDFEFQMLMGVQDKLKVKLVGEGYTVCGYIPYGKGWLGYFLRRLNEQKRNLKTAFISLLRQD